MLHLRQYQRDAIDAVRGGWESMLRVGVVLPTGAGKTVTFSHLIAETDVRTVVLVHRDELAKQALDKIRSVAPDLDLGLVKAESDEVDRQVVVASVQTLMRDNRMEQYLDYGVPGLVVVDESHHAAAPSYKKVMEALGCFEDTRTVGFTATMNRSDERGLGDVWEDVAYYRDVMWGIINGFLVDVEAETVEVDGLDLGTIARSRGDYQEGELGEALERSGAGEVIAKTYKERARDRQGVIFTPTVATAYSFADDFSDHGIVTEVITGETPVEERAEIFGRYRRGETQVLSNCMVLTEGWDMPQAEVAVIARPTQSQALFQQMSGRVLRPFPGKDRALIMDVVGMRAASLRSIVDLSETKIEPRQGKSLAEMYELDREDEANLERDVVTGKVTSKVRNLFEASSSMWLKTKKGVWFIPTNQCFVFLWPDDDGNFKVGRTGTDKSMKGGGWLKEDGVALHYALAWGEQFAHDIDRKGHWDSMLSDKMSGMVGDRAASWRKKKQKPSETQKAMADSLRIKYTEATRKDELSDKISIHFASKLLDGK